MIYSKRISEGKQSLGASFEIKNKARGLRNCQTDQEKKLWEKLRNGQINGMHFRRQHPYNIYIIDFYCFKANLAIEIDGKIHIGRRQYDEERTRFIESSGIKVIRFKNGDIENRIDWVVDEIKKAINNNPNHVPR